MYREHEPSQDLRLGSAWMLSRRFRSNSSGRRLECSLLLFGLSSIVYFYISLDLWCETDE